MSLKITQSLKQSQTLTMTPQLQQAIKMLSMTSMELSEHISQQILENPMLEEAESEEYFDIDNDLDIKASDSKDSGNDENSESSKEEDWENYLNVFDSLSLKDRQEAISDDLDAANSMENLGSGSLEETLIEHLVWQLCLKELPPEEEAFALYLLGNLDESGHLGEKPLKLFNDFTYPIFISDKRKKEILEIIWQLDPIGCGAENVKESLLVQTKFYFPENKNLQQLIQNHLFDLDKIGSYGHIALALGIKASRVKELVEILKELSPFPGRAFSEASTGYIVPDLLLRRDGNNLSLDLNFESFRAPQISALGKIYLKTKKMSAHDDLETKQYITERMKAAMWLLKSLGNRQSTLLRVGKSILRRQKDFFLKGPNSLRPMILRDVAQELELHESTVSRVTTNKYLQTNRGVFELKYFFSSGIGKNAEHEGVTGKFLQEKIREFISSEDTSRPLSDQKIADLLQYEKIKIARRTVAKYRELMAIRPASQRKLGMQI